MTLVIGLVVRQGDGDKPGSRRVGSFCLARQGLLHHFKQGEGTFISFNMEEQASFLGPPGSGHCRFKISENIDTKFSMLHLRDPFFIIRVLTKAEWTCQD